MSHYLAVDYGLVSTPHGRMAPTDDELLEQHYDHLFATVGEEISDWCDAGCPGPAPRHGDGYSQFAEDCSRGDAWIEMQEEIVRAALAFLVADTPLSRTNLEAATQAFRDLLTGECADTLAQRIYDRTAHRVVYIPEPKDSP